MTPEVQSDEDRLMAILVEAAGLIPPEQLRHALYDEMRDLRRLAAILRTMPLDQVVSASTFRTPLP